MPEEVLRAAGLLERRWTVSILYAAHEGAVRFNEFQRSVGRISPATLAARLGELEQAGVLQRHVVSSRPPRVEYVLTERGRALEAVLAAVRAFAQA